MRSRELENQRRKRIAAGVEEAMSNNETNNISTSSVEYIDETIEMPDENLEITVIQLGSDEKINEKNSIPIDIVDASGRIISKKVTRIIKA